MAQYPPGRPADPMKIRAAVVDPLPLYRYGVAAGLEAAGWRVDLPDDLWAWITEGPGQVVLLGVCGTADWQLLADLRAAGPEIRLLAMIDEPDVPAYLRAIRAGASGVVERACSPATLQASFRAVANGQAILPAEVVQVLAAAHRTVDEPDPSEEERGWLRQLAAGTTVAELATSAGYSERMMFRRLRALYSRLSVSNRTEALIHAHRSGWL
jgi:DNA-binding NarL/FixJ family response regulator